MIAAAADSTVSGAELLGRAHVCQMLCALQVTLRFVEKASLTNSK